MNGPFKIGEILVFKNPWAQNDEECTVIGPLAWRPHEDERGRTAESWACLVSTAGIEALVVGEIYLSCRQPPQELTGEQRIRELFTPAPTKELEPA